MPHHQDKTGQWHASACVQRRRLHRRLPAGATASDAKQLAAQLRLELTATIDAERRQRNTAPPVAGDPLIADCMAAYIAHHAPTLASPSTAAHHAKRIGAWVGSHRASQARAVAAAIKQDMHGHYAAGTINRSLGTLKKALNIAWQTGQAVSNWGDHVAFVPEHNQRTQTLSADTIKRLAEDLGPEPRAALYISLYTGLRRAEVIALQPGMINLDAGTITLPASATKTRRVRTVPIIAPLRPWLAALPFTLTPDGIKSAVRRSCARLGLTNHVFRDARRTVATNLIQSGAATLQEVSHLLGHSSTAVTERVYAHLSVAQISKALSSLPDLHQPFTPGQSERAHRKMKKASK